MRESHEERVIDKLDDLRNILEFILERLLIMSASLDALTAEVARLKSVDASAVALIQGFQAKLDAAIAAAKAGDDSAALDALSADLKSSTDTLAQAVAANTPAAPTP